MHLSLRARCVSVLLAVTAALAIHPATACARTAISEKLAIAVADHIPFAGHLYVITTYSDGTTALYQAGPSGPYGTGHLVLQNYTENTDPPPDRYVVPPRTPPMLDAAFRLFDYLYGLWPVSELPNYDAFSTNSNAWAFGLFEVSGFPNDQVAQLISTVQKSSGLDPIGGNAKDAVPVVPFFYGPPSPQTSMNRPGSAGPPDALGRHARSPAMSPRPGPASLSVLNERLQRLRDTSRQLPFLPDARAVAVNGNTAYVSIVDWSAAPSPDNHETPLEQDYRYGQVWQQYYAELTGTPNPHVAIVYHVVRGGHARVFRQECCERF